MKKISIRLVAFLILTNFLLLNSYAQRPSELRKQKEGNAVKSSVFGDDDPAFKINDIPEKWKNESAVVINQKMEYNYVRDNAIMHVYETIRKRIKLQDQAAVEKFSEFYYVTAQEVGVQIVKPDGKVVDVSTESAVEVEIQPPAIFRPYHSYKLSYNKLAVPNLEVGDIIDYYYYVDNEYNASLILSKAFDPFLFTLGTSYPIMNQKLNFSIDRGFFINFNSYNGAPDLIEGEAGYDSRGRQRGNIKTYSLTDKDRDRIEDEIWDYHFRDYPFVKFQVYWISPSVLKNTGVLVGEIGEAKHSVTPEEIVEVVEKKVKSDAYYGGTYSKTVLSYLNRYHKQVSDPVELARLTYYYLRYAMLDGHYVFSNGHYSYGDKNEKLVYSNDLRFANVMTTVLQRRKIPAYIAAVVPRHLGTIDDVLLDDELLLLVYLPGSQRFVFPFSSFSTFDYINPDYEGQKACIIKDKGAYELVSLPESRPKDNMIASITRVNFSDDMEVLTFNRSNTIVGDYKDSYSKVLLSDYDFLLDDKLVYDPRYEPDGRERGNKVKIAEEKRKKEEKKKELRDEVLKQLESFVEDDFTIESYDDFNVESPGRTEAYPQLVYDETFTVKNLVNKAGNNYIFEAGKLITSQIKLDEDDKKSRKTNVYISSAKTYSYDMTIELPAGYVAEGYDQLNYKVDNQYGSFVSTAEMKDNKLHITAEKIYKKNFVKKEEWEKVIAFLDPAYEFSQKKIILKKQ